MRLQICDVRYRYKVFGIDLWYSVQIYGTIGMVLCKVLYLILCRAVVFYVVLYFSMVLCRDVCCFRFMILSVDLMGSAYIYGTLYGTCRSMVLYRFRKLCGTLHRSIILRSILQIYNSFYISAVCAMFRSVILCGTLQRFIMLYGTLATCNTLYRSRVLCIDLRFSIACWVDLGYQVILYVYTVL